MTETYQEMKNRHQKEYNDYTKNCVFFAFSNKQFDEGMQKLGLKPDETDKIYSIGHGGFILRTKSKEHNELFLRFAKEKQQAIDNDKDGTGFIRQMFEYEMNNHEYGYTRDITDTLDAVGYTAEEIATDEKLLNGFKIARKTVIDWYDEHN
ncbi:hypothetical protein IJ674_10330 [bacterium]|nr:hypothetical protein [bacterium]